MPVHHGTVLCLVVLLISAWAAVLIVLGKPFLAIAVFAGGILFGLTGLVTRLCMKKHQLAASGHPVLQPRTGTRLNPQQAVTIQRRLDQIRREISTESVRVPEPDPSLPSTPPPWIMEPPPSYDTVMKSQEHRENLEETSGAISEHQCNRPLTCLKTNTLNPDTDQTKEEETAAAKKTSY